MKPHRQAIAGPSGQLEAVVESPDSNPRGVAVVAHPHPLYGGDMDNGVVTLTAQALRGCGFSTVRFNFRGVGESDGRHDGGEGEVADLGAALRFARSSGEGRLLLAGYSFGAAMTHRLLSSGDSAPDLAAVLMLAPPTTHYPFEPEANSEVPRAIVCGELDDFTPPAARSQMAAWPSTRTVEVVPGAGHDLGTFGDPQPLRSALDEALSRLLETL